MYRAAPHPIASTLACSACSCTVRTTPTRSRVRPERRWATVLTTGIIPLGRVDLPHAHPGLVPSVAAARLVLRYAYEGGLIPKPPAFVHYSYRRQGQRGTSSTVVIDTAMHPDPQAALTALIGPLLVFAAAEAPARKPRSVPQAARLTLTLARVQPAPATTPASPRPRPWQAVMQPRTSAPPPRPIRGPDSQATPRLRAPTPPSDTTAGRIGELSRAVRNLTISWQNPWRYYEERSSIAAELASLARTLGAAA